MRLIEFESATAGNPLVASRARMQRLTRHEYGGGGGDGSDIEKKRQANLDAGMSQISNIFGRYNDDFYKERGKAYTDFAVPQVQQQFKTTRNNLAYALARNGILSSSTANQRNQDLQSELSKNLTTVGNQAQGEMNKLRSDVSNARSNLTNQLISSGDPSVISGNAAVATQGISSTPSFNSLGDMFGNWTNTYLTNINARAYNPAVPSLRQQLFG